MMVFMEWSRKPEYTIIELGAYLGGGGKSLEVLKT